MGRMVIGTIGSPHRAVVDPAGTLTSETDGWSLSWAVCAGDTWHEPRQETGVRHGLVGHEPILETKMRVGGGDAVVRMYAVVARGIGDVAVVEVENQTAAPIAIGFTVAGVHDRLLTPRPPTWEEDTAVLPVVHRSTLRVAVPLSPTPDATLPDALPSAEDVARAWLVQARRGLQADLPAGPRADRFEVARRRLLLAFAGDRVMADDPGPVVAALDLLGFDREAADVLVALPAHQHFDGSFGPRAERLTITAGFVHAAAVHWELTGDRAVLDATLPAVALAARALARARTGQEMLTAAAGLLDDAGESKAAAQCRKAAARAASAPPPIHPLARFRHRLVDDRGEGLVLLGDVPEEWRRQPLAVHDAPTRHGRVSFAVRWHGDRPALLWEVDGDGPLRLTAPGVAERWETDRRRGEEMLA